MKRTHVLGTIALAGLLGTSGCYVTARGHIAAPVAVVEVEEAPPPPRIVQVDVRPGFIYIQGRWVRSGGRWVWNDGYYERERPGYAYEQGHWDRRGNQHVWVEGRWNSGPVVRDHRVPEARREGPVVRDHRHEERHDGPIVRDHR